MCISIWNLFPFQVRRFLEEEIKPTLKPYANWLDEIAELDL